MTNFLSVILPGCVVKRKELNRPFCALLLKLFKEVRTHLPIFRIKIKGTPADGVKLDLYFGGIDEWRIGRLHEAKGLLVVTCTGHNSGENEQNKNKIKTRKWHQIVLLITNTCDIIAFSTVANRQLGYKQMLMTY